MMSIDELPRLLLYVMCNAIQHYGDNIIVRDLSVWKTNMENKTYFTDFFYFFFFYTPLLGGRESWGQRQNKFQIVFRIEGLRNV